MKGEKEEISINNEHNSFSSENNSAKNSEKLKIIYNKLNFDCSEEIKYIKGVPKSSTLDKPKNIFSKKESIISHKKLIIDERIINDLNLNNEKENKIIIENKSKGKKEIKKVNDKTKSNKKEKYYTPKKEVNYKELEKIYKEKGKKIVKIVRKEKANKDKKLQKHQHQAKKDMNEEIHMSGIKPQNDDKKKEMEIIGEEEEEIDENNNEKKEENHSKEKEDKSNEISDDKSLQKKELIDEFIDSLDNKKEESNIINISTKDKNKIKEDESEDPFEKAENEYRLQQNEENEDEDDIIKDIELDINEIKNDEKEYMKERDVEMTKNENEKVLNKEEKEKEKEIEIENEKAIKEKEKTEKDEKDENNDINLNDNSDNGYYKTYLNSLNRKTDSYNPLINKHPGNLYLREVYQCQSYREKMKKYNKKTGKFDLFLNKFEINNILSKKENKFNYDNSKENISNNTFENFKKFTKENFSKNSMQLKEYKYNSPKNTVLNKYLINTIHTTRLNTKKNIFKKQYSLNKERRLNTEANIHNKKGNNHIQEMIKFMLDKNSENEKTKKKLNPVNKRRNSEQNNKIVDILNDPSNPYSTIWPNKFLNINYNFGIHYTEVEKGVPQLKLKQLKKNKNLPPLYYKTILNDDNNFRNTFTSGINRNNHVQHKEIISHFNNDEVKKKEENKNDNNHSDISKTISHFHTINNDEITEIIEEEI